MPLVVKNGLLLRNGSKLASNKACCCGKCNSKCANGGLPESLVVSITSVWRSPLSDFDPVGDWIVYLQDDCGTYSGKYGNGLFYAQDNCAYYPCEGTCIYNLQIYLYLSYVTAAPQIYFIWGDSGGGSRFLAGNLRNIDYTSNVCNRTLPVSNTTNGTYCASGHISYTVSLP